LSELLPHRSASVLLPQTPSPNIAKDKKAA
jgi:hypothetical protein